MGTDFYLNKNDDMKLTIMPIINVRITEIPIKFLTVETRSNIFTFAPNLNSFLGKICLFNLQTGLQNATKKIATNENVINY